MKFFRRVIQIAGFKSGRSGLRFLVLTMLAAWFSAQAAVSLPQHPPLDGYGIIDAFPGLKFEQPVALRAPPGETNRLFVVERKGRIMVITNLAAPTASVFLDLSTNVTSVSWEEGLLGMAFHPGYSTNGRFFVYRTALTSSAAVQYAFHDVLSSFRVSPQDPNRALPDSETKIITQVDAAAHHNAGDIAFGPDGYLYLSIGDSSPSGDDIPVRLQAIDKGLFGVIVRIDVDKKPGNLLPNPHPSSSTNYLIPKDNPFIGVTNYMGDPVDPRKVRTELFAIGFRNPWRFGIHPQTGALLVGDVGNGVAEEIDLVVKGGNYGWPYYEGSHQNWLNLPSAPARFQQLAPLVEYQHGNSTNEGNAVMAGLFYFGQKIPQLRGKFIYGDFRRGHIWALQNDGINFSAKPERIACSPDLCSFAADPRDQELLICNIGSGTVQKLVYTPPETAPAFPQTLGEIGAFSDLVLLSPAAEMVPYGINHPFWSDNAIKRRWYVPPASGQKVIFSTNDYGSLPVGAVWVKHFELELNVGHPESRRRLETRFLVKTNTGVYGVTYRWNADGKDARLVGDLGEDETILISDGQTTRTQVWHYPARAECRKCHSDEGGQALGFNIAQLNKLVPGPRRGSGLTNQLELFVNMGLIETHSANFDELPGLASVNDSTQPLLTRLKSYFSANCSFCHYGPNLNAVWDGRFSTPYSRMGISALLDVNTNPTNSGVFARIATDDVRRMPPISRAVVDTNAVELLRAWIASIPAAPWIMQDIGNVSTEGYSQVETGRLTVSGTGTGTTAAATDSGQLLSLNVAQDVTATVRLLNQNSRPAAGGAGLMFRSSLAANAPFAFFGKTRAGSPSLSYRRSDGENAVLLTRPASGDWLRLERRGGTINAYSSEDGVNWVENGSFPVNLQGSFFAGLFSHSGGSSVLNNAAFDKLGILSVGLAEPADGATFLPFDAITMRAQPYLFPTNAARVQYYATGNLIGEATTGDFSFRWTNSLAGDYQIAARLIDSDGAAVWSETRTIHVQFSPPKALFRSINETVRGAWRTNFGSEAYLLPGIGTNAPAFGTFQPPALPVTVLENPSVDPRALASPTNGPGKATAWAGDEISLKLTLFDGIPHRLSLYFVDWNGSGIIQRVEIRNPADGTTLASQTISNFSGGLYLHFRVRGPIEILVSGANGLNASLSGVFLDATRAAPPTVNITAPQNNSSSIASQSILVEAAAQDPDEDLHSVEFYANNIKMGEASAPPYRLLWTQPRAGNYILVARATDEFALSAESSPIAINVRFPNASAAFLGADNDTKGNWIGRYGTAGYQLMSVATNLPSFLNLSPDSAVVSEFKELSAATEQRSLLTPDGQLRFVAYFHEWTLFKMRVSFPDGLPHRFSLYFLDWPRSGCNERVRFKTIDGAILDDRLLAEFQEGRYLSWSIKGDVILEIEPGLGLGYGFLNGIFIDNPGETNPNVTLSSPANGSAFHFGDDILLQADVSPGSVAGRIVEFFANGNKIGTAGQPPYFLRWRAPVGEFEIYARFVNADGEMADSPSVRITVLPANGPSAAVFIGSDDSTHGDWRDAYGKNGFLLPVVGTNLPPSLTVTSDGQLYSWEWGPTDNRALMGATGPYRAATTYFSADTFDVTVNPDDGDWRRFSIYCLDWDLGWRAQQIDILERNTDRQLDRQIVQAYGGGRYLSWLVHGPIVARFKSIASHALVSGVFFDDVPNLEQWRLSHFAYGAEEGANEMDPDNDGVPNLSEYKFNLDPHHADARTLLAFANSNQGFHLLVRVNSKASDVDIAFEKSTDLIHWEPANDRISIYKTSPIGSDDLLELEVNTSALQSVFIRIKGAKISDRF